MSPEMEAAKQAIVNTPVPPGYGYPAGVELGDYMSETFLETVNMEFLLLQFQGFITYLRKYKNAPEVTVLWNEPPDSRWLVELTQAMNETIND